MSVQEIRDNAGACRRYAQRARDFKSDLALGPEYTWVSESAEAHAELLRERREELEKAAERLDRAGRQLDDHADGVERTKRYLAMIPDGEDIRDWLRNSVAPEAAAIRDQVGDGIDALGDTVDDGLQWAGDGARYLGDKAGDGLEWAGDGIRDLGGKAGDAVKGLKPRKFW